MKDMNTVLSDIRFRFNIDHPSFEECYAHGYESASANHTEEDNPFQDGSKESEQWLEGWWAGFYQEEPLYDLSELMESSKDINAANEADYHSSFNESVFLKVLEITGVLAVSAILGYQVLDLVA